MTCIQFAHAQYIMYISLYSVYRIVFCAWNCLFLKKKKQKKQIILYPIQCRPSRELPRRREHIAITPLSRTLLFRPSLATVESQVHVVLLK